MQKKDRQRLVVVGSIITAAVVLWLLLRRAGVSVVQQAGTVLPYGVGGVNFSLPGVPTLDYTTPNSSYTSVGASKGCLLCFAGYQRIVPPSPPPVYEAPPPATIYNLISQYPAPPSATIGRAN